MPLKLSGNTLLKTTSTGLLYGGSPVSFSVWMRLDVQTGWVDQNRLMSCGSNNHSWLDLAADGIYAQVQTHDTTDHVIYHRSTPPTIGLAYHVALVTGDGNLTLYVNGVTIWAGSWPGTEGLLGFPGSYPLELGCYDGAVYTLQDPAIWVGYRLTQSDVLALRDRTQNPGQISSTHLIWWLTLAGFGGVAAQVGDSGLTDQSTNGFSITSITAGGSGTPTIAPTYQAADLVYVPPSRVSSAAVTPARNSIVLFFSDTVGNHVNLQSISANPTLTTQSLNGGAPFTLSNPIWGVSAAYLPWVYFPLSGSIPSTDTPTLSSASSWAMTTAGPVAKLSGYSVDVTTHATLLPPFSTAPKTMPIGYNAAKPPVYYSTVPIYSNHAKQIAGWYGASASFDSFQVPTQVAAGQTLNAGVVSPPNDNTTNDKGCCTACPSGIWALMWDGQAIDAGTGQPLLYIDGGGVTGCSVSSTGTDSLPGTTNNKRLYQVTQDQTYRWSPTIYIHVRGRSDGASYSPPIANIRVYGPDPANTSQPLSDSSPKFHPSYLNMLAGARCLRFSLNDVVDFSDFLPVGTLGYSMIGRSYGNETITRIDPYTDSAGYFGNRATALVTFAAPHNIKNGNIIRLHIPGPNTDDSFPLTGVAPNDHGWMMDSGVGDNSGLCLYNSATMSNTQLVFAFSTPSGLSAPCTLTQYWTASGVGKSWYSAGWPNNVTSPGIPPAECCDLANAVGADLWLSVSYNMTDACIGSLFNLIASRLNSGLKIYLEYTNETWNYYFQAYNYCVYNGNTVGLSNPQWYTLRASQVHQAAYTALQSDSPPRGGDLVRVFGAQGANAGNTTAPITAYAAAHSIPIDVIAVAPYFENMVSPFLGGGESSLNSVYDTCSSDQLMDLGELFILYGGYEQYIASHTSYVGSGTSFPNAKIVCYEGGPEVGLPGSSLSGGARIERGEIWVRHPRMRGIMLYFLQMLQDHGCALFNDYLVASQDEFTSGNNWNAYYTWNMKPGMGDGSDGLGDNHLFAAPATVAYQDYGRLVSVVGGAINYWNSLLSSRTPAGHVVTIPYKVGRNVFAVLVDMSHGLFWNGSTFKTWSDAEFASYPIVVSAVGSSGCYTFPLPSTVGPGDYFAMLFERSGSVPALSDLAAGPVVTVWDIDVATSASIMPESINAIQFNSFAFN